MCFPATNPQSMSSARAAIAEEPGWRYGDLLPLRSRGDAPNVELQPAMPGALRSTLRGLLDLVEGPYTGQMTPEATLALPTLAAPLGAALAPKNSLGVFAGRMAQTADKTALARAESLAAAGADPEDIWRATGWFRGADNAWRFEIDDSAAHAIRQKGSALEYMQDTGTAAEYPTSLSATFRHPLLFAAHPDLADTLTRIKNTAIGGSYSPGQRVYGEMIEAPLKHDMTGAISRPDRAKASLLHEAQHAVQQREGFARGGHPDLLPPGQYRRLAGEVEARAVEARRNLTPEQRAARAPWLDYEYPMSDQIVGPLR